MDEKGSALAKVVAISNLEGCGKIAVSI